MARVSPTLEGFRAAFWRPSLALGEITWRWVVGATAIALFFFGLSEYLRTLPVTNGELLFLRTRQPYLVAQAILHILRGSADRALMSAILAALCIALLWMIAASLGRIATVGVMRDYFRDRLAANTVRVADARDSDQEKEIGSTTASPLRTLLRLNFLRVALAVSGIVGLVGAAIVAGAASPDSDPQPELAFLLFLPLAALVWLAWSGLNWLLSLASIFAVRDREDAIGAISAAANLCGDKTGAVLAVSTWTAVAHLVAFVGATTAASMVLGFVGIVPSRLVALGVSVVTLAYFAVADWLYTARLAGYVCIAEMPEELLRPLPPPLTPPLVPATTIDKDELILSDMTLPESAI